MITPIAISLDHVKKNFVIHKQKSLKERFLNFKLEQAHTEKFSALEDITFEISAGETIGLIGHNGSGKSSLLKLIGGILRPTSGTISVRGRLAALLELGTGFHPDLTGRENVFLNAALLGMSRTETKLRFNEIHDYSGIGDFIDTPVKFYSSGMYVRLAFSVAIHSDPDVLLIDEVLAVGDEPFQKKCIKSIKNFQKEGRTIVFVSHSPDQILDICDRVVLLNHGNVLFDGKPSLGINKLHKIYREISR